MRRPLSLLVGLLALAAAPVATAAALPPPTTILPWGDLPGEPGFRPGGDERPPVGPVAVAADDDRIVVSDPANRQLLVLDPRGQVVDSWPLGFPAVDVALLPDGSVLALDGPGQRVALRDASGAWRALPTPSAGVVTLAVGPDGSPWAVDRLGHGHALDVAPDSGLDRATPLGAGYHGAGRRVDARRGEALVWGWEQPATVRDAGPALTVPVDSDGRLLGTVRPLRVDDHGVLHLLVERLARGRTISVEVAVQRYAARDGRALGDTRWDVANIAPINHPAAVTPGGALVVVAALPEGLALWVIPAAGGSK